jgi:hypothetical protein
MDHPEGAVWQRADRVDFDLRVRLEFRGTQLTSDGGLLVMRELDGALWLSDLSLTSLQLKLIKIGPAPLPSNWPRSRSQAGWCVLFSRPSADYERNR